MRTPHPPARNGSETSSPDFAGSGSVLGPRMTTLVASCALVLTAKALGLEWLAAPILGVPSGLWVVGMSMLLAQYRHQRRLEMADASAAGLLSSRIAIPPIALPSLRDRIPTADHVTGVLEIVGVPAASWEQARKRVNQIGAKVLPSTQPTIRVGVDLCESDREAIFRAGEGETALLNCGVPVEWVKAPSGLVSDAERDLAGLDALVRRERRGDVNIFIPESADRPAAWHDWSMPMPLGYAAVFPPRIDPSRVALSGCDLNDPNAALAAARIALACAMLGRTPPRIGGRRFLGGRTGLAHLAAPGGPIDDLMMRLGDSLRAEDTDRPVPVPGYLRAAARAVGAWVTRSDCGLSEAHRVELAATAARWIEDEPEATLRAAAMCFATGDSEQALRLLAAAGTRLREAGRRCESDPLAFIMSEVELGEPGRTTLGRIAAGLGLLWATSPEANMPYLRDDLMDELAHAGWLADRAEDVQMLQRVVEALQREFGRSGSPVGSRKVA